MSAVREKLAQYWEANPTDLAEKMDLFLAGLTQFGTVKHAAEYAQIDRNTAYDWRNRYPEFRRRWDLVLEDVTDDVEKSLYNQAVSEKNVVATIFYLKNNRNKYRDRVNVDVTVMNSQVEERLECLRARLPSASTKDIINEVLGIPRRQERSEAVEVPRSDNDNHK